MPFWSANAASSQPTKSRKRHENRRLHAQPWRTRRRASPQRSRWNRRIACDGARARLSV